MAKKTYVLDTSVLLTDFDSINKFENNDIVIPLKVLEEVDRHKKRQDSVGSNARSFIRILDSLREKGSLEKDVYPQLINRKKIYIYVFQCKKSS